MSSQTGSMTESGWTNSASVRLQMCMRSFVYGHLRTGSKRFHAKTAAKALFSRMHRLVSFKRAQGSEIFVALWTLIKWSVATFRTFMIWENHSWAKRFPTCSTNKAIFPRLNRIRFFVGISKMIVKFFWVRVHFIA